jgi:hypothetical protein
MQAVDSAVALAGDLGTRLDIWWVRAGDLRCRFDRLFEPIPQPSVHVHERRLRPMRFARTHRLVRRLSRIWPLGALAFSKDETRRLMAHDFRSMDPRRTVIIESFSRFYPSPRPYACFTPVPELRRRIAERTARFGPHTIGVHVRRTDHAKAVAVSSDAAFIDRMRREIAAQPATSFYLATDSMDVKRTFTEMFGERIVTTPYEASRQSVDGVQEAVVELYALAATTKILGSYWSTYSSAAAELGRIELVTIRADEASGAA